MRIADGRESVGRPRRPFVPVTIRALIIAAVLIPASVAAGRGGTITGVVKWTGPAPQRPELNRATDPVCAKVARRSEDLVVEAGKLRDVHVRLKNGSAGKHAPPATPAVVIQHECMYGPRVVGVVEGQALEIRNDDPTFHNVRVNLGPKVLWNLGQAAAQPPIVRSDLGKAGEVVSLHCDVHPWMAGWAVVTDHPYFAVTGTGGEFVIKNVPAGSYTLEAWHPTLGLTSTKVRVRPGRTVTTSFAFAPATSGAGTASSAKR